MAKTKEIRTAMPAEFVKIFLATADELGMTPRQFASVCFSLGYKSFMSKAASSLPSEPSPIEAQIPENSPVSRVGAADDAKRRLPFTPQANLKV